MEFRNLFTSLITNTFKNILLLVLIMPDFPFEPGNMQKLLMDIVFDAARRNLPRIMTRDCSTFARERVVLVNADFVIEEDKGILITGNLGKVVQYEFGMVGVKRDVYYFRRYLTESYQREHPEAILSKLSTWLYLPKDGKPMGFNIQPEHNPEKLVDLCMIVYIENPYAKPVSIIEEGGIVSTEGAPMNPSISKIIKSLGRPYRVGKDDVQKGMVTNAVESLPRAGYKPSIISTDKMVEKPTDLKVYLYFKEFLKTELKAHS